MKLIYSPDDADNYGKGYYWQRYSDWQTSQLFETALEAKRAKIRKELKWS